LEARIYAQAVADLIAPIVPMAYQAFKDYMVNSRNFSEKEMVLLRKFIKSSPVYKEDTLPEEWGSIVEQMTEREKHEFIDKFRGFE
jgi:hypothetical protein